MVVTSEALSWFLLNCISYSFYLFDELSWQISNKYNAQVKAHRKMFKVVYSVTTSIMTMHFQNKPDLIKFILGLPVLDLSSFDPFRRNSSPPTKDFKKQLGGRM